MSEIERKVAAAICENLFGPFDASELGSPSSVSAQSMVAARAALDVTANTLEQRAGNPIYQKAWKAAARFLRQLKTDEVNRSGYEVN